MSDNSHVDTFATSRIEEQLLAAGWPKSGILREPLITTEGRRYRPTFVLTYNLYPFAAVEVVSSPEQAPKYKTIDSHEEIGSLPFWLIANGSYTFRQDVTAPQAWSHVPSPEDLWNVLGREWSKEDPRLFPASFSAAPALHHSLAVGRALDALMEGRQRIQILMPAGTGKSLVVRELAWKLIGAQRRHRALYVTSLRADAAQMLHRLVEAFGSNARLLRGEESLEYSVVHVATAAYMRSLLRSRQGDLPSDFYDLIFIPELRERRAWGEVVEYFSGATVVGFSSSQVLFGEAGFNRPEFQLSIEDALASEELRLPDGYCQVRLGDIAEIAVGLRSGMYGRDVPLLRARDLPVGDARLAIGELVSAEASEEDIARYAVREHDILIAGVQNDFIPRVCIVTGPVPPSVLMHSSICRVRITDSRINPFDVISFLQSGAGRLAMLLVASALGGHVRLSASSLAQVLVMLPAIADSKSPREEHPPKEESLSSPSLSLANQAVRRIRESVLPELEALERDDQTVDPMLVAARLREIAASLVSPPLPERVLSRYPMPIALAYRRFHDSRFNVYEQVLRLRDLFEAASFFVFNLVLADACQRLDHKEYYVPDKRVRHAYDGASMAYRIAFVKEIARMARAGDPRHLFMPALCDSSFAELAETLQANFRNKISHSATASESRQRRLLDQYRPMVEEMLEEISFLEGYRLARMSSIFMRGGKYVRRIELYQGVAPALDEQEFERGQQPSLAERDHLVLLDESDDYLDLYPMYQIVDDHQTGEDAHICFLKQRRGGVLEGESIHGPIAVRLEGFLHFETLRSRLVDGD